MDWADDVTYAVHDAADFFRAGLIPLEALSSRRDDSERMRFFSGVFGRHPDPPKTLGYPKASLEEAFIGLTQYFPFDEKYRGTVSHRAKLRYQSAGLIKRYVYAVELTKPARSGEEFLSIDPARHQEVLMLKELTWQYVILNPSLTTQQHGQRTIVRNLFEIFQEAAGKEKHRNIFPQAFREQLRQAANGRERTRIVSDFIAGMTEHQAIRLHGRLTGKALGSVLEYL
jgi:dGTPase